VLDCGPPLDGCQVRIVDDDDESCGDRVLGHIQLRGPNASPGYIADAEANAAAHCGDWWRSGDLGFLDDGRLTVCGRVKELIFAAGRNFYAQDIETVAEEVAAVRAAVACAVPAPDGAGEQTVLFVALERTPPEQRDAVLQAARRRVQRDVGIAVDSLVPIAYREIPRTSSGKVRRLELGAGFVRGDFDQRAWRGPVSAVSASAPLAPGATEELVTKIWAEVLALDPASIPPDRHFIELGGTSLKAQEVLARLEEACGRWFSHDLLIECATVAEMAGYLREQRGSTGAAAEPPSPVVVDQQGGQEIAVLAAACAFADADSPEQLWRNLREGRDSVGALPVGRWSSRAADGITCRAGSFLTDPYLFDPALFDLDAAECEVMDPQQRLLLDLGLDCLERGALGATARARERIGVFVGASQLPYQEVLTEATQRQEAFALLERSEAFRALASAEQERLRAAFETIVAAQPLHPGALVGNLLNMLAARVAHQLDLKGPALAIDTACSSSLVALHQACDSLRRGECDLALAGGVSLNLTPTLYRYFEAARALSPTGQSRPFALDADGFVPGEGGALVLLRPLCVALAHGDRVLAVIKGSAVNNDGRSIGAMAPNPEGQIQVLRAAYAQAGVDPDSVDLLECHGTGTRIGDPIELRALQAFFARGPERALAIGSVKSNLGHLLGAAGIAGFLKAVLALTNRTLPPSLHSDPPNPRLSGSGLRLQTEAQPWSSTQPRRAGINSFGFGGTNCHLILEEAPSRELHSRIDPPRPQLLLLGAPSAQHLQRASDELAEAVSATAADAGDCAPLCQELLEARPIGRYRAARVVDDLGAAQSALVAFSRGETVGWLGANGRAGRQLRVAWLFPGQGAQFLEQARGLLQGWPAFGERFAELSAAVELERPLLDFCYGADADVAALQRTDVAQPLLVAFQIALAEALRELGLAPCTVLGHSVGELAAASVAGALDADRAVELAARRGACMQQSPPGGGMLAVMAGAEQVRPLLRAHPNVVLAADNGPAQCVLAATTEHLDEVVQRLRRLGLPALRVPVAHAFHSPQMQAAATDFVDSAGELRSGELQLPLASTVRGALLGAGELSTAYLAEQITGPVRFAPALEALVDHGVDVLLEIGPGATLRGLVQRQLEGERARPCLALCRGPAAVDEAADWRQALDALGQLWCRGVHLARLPGERLPPRARPLLPPAPRLRTRYQLRPPAPERADEPGRLLHQRGWRPAPAPGAKITLSGCWLVFVDAGGVGAALAHRLRQAGCRAVEVAAARSFTRQAEDDFALDRSRDDHLRWLWQGIDAERIEGLVLLSGLEAPASGAPDARAASPLDAVLGLAALARTLAAQPAAPRLLVATGDGLAAAGTLTSPSAAAAAAMARALGAERPELRCQVVDLASQDTATVDAAADALVAELTRPVADLVVLQGGERGSPSWQQLEPERTAASSVFHADATYLLIGGAGGVGVALVRHIAVRCGSAQPRIVLAGRRSAEEVSAVLAELHAEGVQAEYRQLDVRDLEQVAALVAALRQERGLDGVVHAAGAVQLGSLRHRGEVELRTVLEAKVLGAVNLATALAGTKLDFVALISSVAGSFAPLGRGLADYAAANAFVDALARQRRAQGEPWTALAFSRWRGVGMARGAAEGGRELIELDPAQACHAAELALARQLAAVVIAEPDDVETWQRAEAVPEHSAAPAPVPEQPPASAPAPTPEQPAASAPALEPTPVVAPAAVSTAATHAVTPLEPAALERFMRRRLAVALDLAPGEIALDASFQSLGLSSLAAVDLLKELEEETGQQLDVTLLFERNTLGQVLDFFAERAPATARTEAPSPAPDTKEVFPLLPAQQTFYANQRFFPALPCYVYMRLDLEGPVSPPLLERALGVLCQRHPMLDMVFEWGEAGLVQRRAGLHAPRLELRDLRGLDAVAQRAEIERWDQACRDRVFDLERGPLFQLGLARCDDERASLLFNVHHIVADAWSAQLIVAELLELHRRLQRGEPPELPPLRSDFRACADAIDTAASSAAGEESLRYWRQRFAAPVAELNLPYDGDPRAEPRGPCRVHQLELNRQTTAALELLARRHEVSPFHLLLSSYQLCLRRWSGQTDIVVRVANARREARLPDIERVVGSFADSLPVRVDVSDRLTPRDLARRVQAECVAAQRHPLTSSMQLAGLGSQRDHAGPRGVTPAGISFPSFPAPTRYGDLRVRAMRGGAASGFTQLGLIAWSFDGRLQLSWNTTDSLFHPATVARLAAEHRALLEELCAEALNAGSSSRARTITTLQRAATPPLSVGPRRALPPGEVVHQRILDRVAEIPDRVALRLRDREVSYGELGTRVRRLAAALRHGGERPGELVGVLARPGLEATVGVLGVMAAGAAYVPLDPEYPDARVAAIGQHAGFKVLVTTSDQLPRLERSLASDGTRVLLLDQPTPDQLVGARASASAVLREARPWSALDDDAGEALGTVRGDDLAYVMYTSGTTGQPKGVMVTHRAISLFHDWVHETFAIGPEDRFLQVSALSFGGSMRQIYSPLLAGATLIPAPPGATRDPLALVELVEANAITVWNSVPTLWMSLLGAIEQLEREGRHVELESVRWVLIGGEKIPIPAVLRWQARFGHRQRIVNLYGSTETVVNATWHEVDADLTGADLHIPIGRARAGCEVHVLDSDGQPCAAGAVGELHVGGPSLASGYWREPALTAQAFVERPQGRLYRTGDLGRDDGSGRFTYTGRSDSQVKVRGYRVELSEIEAVLAQPTAVRAAAVIEHHDGARQWLVGFVEPVDGAVLESPELRAHVAEALPQYMVPHRFEVLATLPLTAAGKVDRRALRERLVAQRPQQRGTTPASATERKLAAIWCAVLGLEQVGRDDDFFELGGDSILALDVLQRLRGQVPVLPRPITLYGERSIARLAQVIDDLAAAADLDAASATETTSVTAVAVDDGAPLPLTPTQESFVLAQRLAPETPPLWCAQIPVIGQLDPDRFTAALERGVERHPMLRTIFEREDLKTRQRVLPSVELPLVIEDLRSLLPAAREAELARRFREERGARFDLALAPAWRMHLCRVDSDAWEWFVTVHHAIGDGWSVQVLGAELLQLYDGGGDSSALPPLRSGFGDVVRLHQARSAAPDARALAYWSETFAEPWSALGLAGLGSRDRGRTLSVSTALDGETVPALRAFAARRGVSLHSVLLCAWFEALARCGGGEELVLGCAISGRDLPLSDVERMVGPLTVALPIRARVDGRDFERDLEAVEAAFTAACRHADLPSDALLRAIPRHPGAPYPPGASAFFSFMDFGALPALRSAALQIDLGRARFHFEAQATGTELMLGVLVDRDLRFNVHGGADGEVKERALSELQQILGAVAAAAPAVDVASAPVGHGAPMFDAVTPRIDAAIVAYLPARARLAELTRAVGGEDDSQQQIMDALFPDAAPRLLEVADTGLGRSGAVLIPRTADELAQFDAVVVASEVAAAVAVAERHGAREVSMAGLLPSWTGYGALVERARSARVVEPGVPAQLTTGHAATVVAVVKTTCRLLDALGLDLGELRLAVLGFGSIGQAATRLLLDLRPAPISISICDLASVERQLQAPLTVLRRHTYTPVAFVAAGDAPPATLLAADLVIAATSQGDLLDVELLRPGALIVDDSFPPVCDPAAATARMREQRDIVVASAGQLAIESEQLPLTAALPPTLAALLGRKIFGPGMPGCRAEPLLRARRSDLPAVQGLVEPAIARQYWEAATALGIKAAPLHLGDFEVGEDLLRRVAELRRLRKGTPGHSVTI